MAVLAWGKPDIIIKRTDISNGIYRRIANPKEDSTKLNTSEGDKSDAKVEGGAIVDTKIKKSTFELTFDEFIKKGGKKTFGDKDGIVEGEYELWYIPEDSACPGLMFPKGRFSVTTAATSADGITQTVKFSALEKDDKTLQMKIGVITKTEAVAGKITAMSIEEMDAEADTEA